MKIAKTMKKAVCALAASGMFLLCGFDSATFELDDLKNYQREFQSESIGTCSTSSVKTYEDYRGISNTGSTQYRYIHDHMTVDETTGLLMDEDGFIGAALGYQYGEIGSRYYFVLDTGIVIPIVKVDAKASADAPDGCTAGGDASVIEFVIDSDKAAEYFGQGSSGLVAMGNLNNYSCFNGHIADVEKVLDAKLEDGVTYENSLKDSGKKDEESDKAPQIDGGY